MQNIIQIYIVCTCYILHQAEAYYMMAKDPVSQLKELADKEQWDPPEYETSRDESFPGNSCRFLTSVHLHKRGKIYGTLSSTKKESKKNAASKALEIIYGEKQENSILISPWRNPTEKDAVSRLNEKSNQENFEVFYTDYVSHGPPHKPVFRISAVVDGYLCDPGRGNTKKIAKEESAKLALASLADQTLYRKVKYAAKKMPASKNGLGKDHVSILEEYCRPREITYEINVLSSSNGQSNWTFFTKINGRTFLARSSQSKNEAKKLSAQVAMKIYLNEKLAMLKRANYEAKLSISKSSYSNFADQTEALVFYVYRLCHETLTENFMSQKVLAAFVMKRSDSDLGTVVSLATGNRTILGDSVTTNGEKILDSHAEVLARRSLKRYFFQQLQNLNDASCIFKSKSDNSKLCLKKNISFHLYISRPPCGDASEFQSIGTDGLKSKQQRRQGVLRTKIEKGEGTIPTINMDDHRIKIHSCSDKICQWNVIGLQGALLNSIVSPVIYLQSIIIGSYRSQQASHFTRALYGRLEGAGLKDTLPYGFQHNRCQIFTTSSSHDNEIIYNGKSSKFSINWCDGDEVVETLDGTLGAVVGSFVEDPVSRISKKRLFQRYLKVSKQKRRHASYVVSKQENHTYQTAKLALKEAFEEQNLYTWKSFGRNVNNFIC